MSKTADSWRLFWVSVIGALNSFVIWCFGFGISRRRDVYWNTLKVGIKNLLLRKLRSLLTVLGVILGWAR